MKTKKSSAPFQTKPTREEIAASEGKTVPDLIAPALKVLFCGINPSLYSAAVGHHFARPGNRFWRTLHRAGFTNRLLAPSEEDELLNAGYGITNLVERATRSAAELSPEEFIEGRRRLLEKVCRFKPNYLAVLGVSAYRMAFEQPKAQLGRQDVLIGEARIWVLPNPSGLNAHYQPKDLAQLFRQFRVALGAKEQNSEIYE